MAGSLASTDRTIFVAIDFGSTFSGIAWAVPNLPKDQNPIIQWPDAYSGTLEGVTSDKVPTELIYENGGLRWGFQIEDHEQRHQWFKLALDPESVLAESELVRQYPNQKELPPPYGITPEKMSTDFLKALRQHTYDILSYKLTPAVVENTSFAFIVTVPALWKDRAKDLTRRCAKGAGMGENVKIITEPEAAAIHALQMMDPHGLEVGQAFILCDCGGGTVDLITYEIVELKPMLKVREATMGKGGVCGSTILNRIFQKHIEDRFKGMRGWNNEVVWRMLWKNSRRLQSATLGAASPFRTASPACLFSILSLTILTSYSAVIPVGSLRDHATKGVKNGKYRMTGEDLAQVFAPVITEITALVDYQITSSRIPPKALLLVGDFGANSYLREQLKQAFPQINVMQPANGWTAVVRGALTKAMAEASPDVCKVNISSRIARKHYGMLMNTKYLVGVHTNGKQFWSHYHGDLHVEAIRWLVSKGDVVTEAESVVANFYSTRLCTAGPFRMQTVDFHSCDGVAPKHKDHSVKHLVTMRVDLSSIPAARYLTIMGADRRQYYKISYQIKATFFSAHTEYTLVFENEPYGKIQAEYV